MGRIFNLASLIIKRFICFSLPLIAIFYIIFIGLYGWEFDSSWIRLIILITGLGLVGLNKYKHKSLDWKTHEFWGLEDPSISKRWKVLGHEDEQLILRPRFDYPYSILSRDRLKIKISEETLRLEGPAYYVDSFQEDVKNENKTIL